MPDVNGTTAIEKTPPAPAARGAAARDFTPRIGGSSMFAIRGAGGKAYLFNGPQLGFDAPEKLLELELHAPGIDLRGMTAPGAPVIGAGWNGHVAWGVTTGASDADDLYAEKLVPGKPERYVFRGQERAMDCRDELISYDSPPSDLLSRKTPESGSRTVRVCRTVHGPVEARAGDRAYARRYAIWGRELETLVGLVGLESAKGVRDVDVAARGFTWNENLMAADDQGHIGYWHRASCRCGRAAGTSGCPTRGRARPSGAAAAADAHAPRHRPPQGWLANWNNLPSAGWTAGDGTARKRMDGPFFRVGWLMRLVRDLQKRGASFDGMQGLIRRAGTTAQQQPLATARLRRAQRGASGPAKAVLDTLLAWDGSYARTAADGTVDPGVATWVAFRAALADLVRDRYGKAADLAAGETVLDPLYGAYHHGAAYHLFDATHLEATGLRTLGAAAYRSAAATAFAALAKRFGSEDPARWREPRRMYEVGAVGATSPEPIPFFDRGTYEQFVELGPGG